MKKGCKILALVVLLAVSSLATAEEMQAYTENDPQLLVSAPQTFQSLNTQQTLLPAVNTGSNQAPAPTSTIQPAVLPTPPEPQRLSIAFPWDELEITEKAEKKSAKEIKAAFGKNPEGFLLWLARKTIGQATTYYYIYGAPGVAFHGYTITKTGKQITGKDDASGSTIAEVHTKLHYYPVITPPIIRPPPVLPPQPIGGWTWVPVTTESIKQAETLLSKVNIKPLGLLIGHSTQVVAGMNHRLLYQIGAGAPENRSYQAYQIYDRFGTETKLTAQATGKIAFETAQQLGWQLPAIEPPVTPKPILLGSKPPVTPKPILLGSKPPTAPQQPKL